jgi:chemotaxis protein MotB
MAGAPGKGGEAARPIIVKRIKKVAGGHHGGAWKIAYADFVTAMMAFFLLMWLLGSTAKGDLSGISAYFASPLQVAMGGGSGAGDASSVVQGGGQDLTRQAGQVRRGDTAAERRTYALKAAQAEFEREEIAKLRVLKEKIEDQLSANPGLKAFKSQIRLDITSEGLRIQIVDEKNRPMFALAHAQLQDYTRNILEEIGRTLNEVPNHISIAGHTDGRAYSGGERGYSNWDLSSERANAARRAMVEAGLDQDKVIRIVGLGSTVLFNPDDPLDPMNRRISIVVMNKRTESAVRKDAIASVGSADETRDVIEGKRPDLLAGEHPPDLRPKFGGRKQQNDPQHSRVELTPTSPRGY